MLAKYSHRTEAISKVSEYNLKEVEPYNEADMYLKHCDMLVQFGENQDSKKPKKDIGLNKRLRK